MGFTAGTIVQDVRIVNEGVVLDRIIAAVIGIAGLRHVFQVSLPAFMGLLQAIGDIADGRLTGTAGRIAIVVYAGRGATGQGDVIRKAGIGHGIVMIGAGILGGEAVDIRRVAATDNGALRLILFHNDDDMVERFHGAGGGRSCAVIVLRRQCNAAAAKVSERQHTDYGKQGENDYADKCFFHDTILAYL